MTELRQSTDRTDAPAGPAVAGPAVAAPDVAGPAVAEPAVAEPAVAGPGAGGPGDGLLAEKAGLVSGGGFWSTKAAPGLGIEPLVLTDGPHGLRKQQPGAEHPGVADSLPATCFPTASALAATWDRDLLRSVGAALGREARAAGVAVLLGPGVNIKRSPLGGRNFEYFSEDPLLTGELAAELVLGLQGEGVGAAVKHFAVNSQETDRMVVDAELDRRALREIYLPAFETVVTRARPWALMCSYNKVNGVYASQNRWLLTALLRQEWGFDGVVVSDWWAVDDRLAALRAGLDLEMPGPAPAHDARILAALRDGTLDPAVLDRAVDRLRDLAARTSPAGPAAAVDEGAHHALAREAAADAIVLLKNDGAALPITGAGLTVAVLGELARTPRYQGAGSSLVNPIRVDGPLDALGTALAAAGSRLVFAPGYALPGGGPATDAGGGGDGGGGDLLGTAVETARGADVAVVFAGSAADADREGFDRDTLRVPAEQEALIAAVAAVVPRTVVVLANGGIVTMEDWHDAVPAVLETWLPGQAGGGAIADVLTGAVCPSGRLPETVPLRLEDTPAYLEFPGTAGRAPYGEGVFVGYRHYGSTGRAVRHPFGHGLSYTTFEHTDLVVERTGPADVAVSVTVTNTGAVAGKDVVQVYVAPPPRAVRGPVRELRGFAKVALAPGESARVSVPLGRRAFAYWDVAADGWVVGPGEHTVQIGRSARDIVLAAPVPLDGDPVSRDLGLDSTVAEWLADPVAAGMLLQGVAAATGVPAEQADLGPLLALASIPLRRVARLPGAPATEEQLALLVHAVRAARG